MWYNTALVVTFALLLLLIVFTVRSLKYSIRHSGEMNGFQRIAQNQSVH